MQLWVNAKTHSHILKLSWPNRRKKLILSGDQQHYVFDVGLWPEPAEIPAGTVVDTSTYFIPRAPLTPWHDWKQAIKLRQRQAREIKSRNPHKLKKFWSKIQVCVVIVCRFHVSRASRFSDFTFSPSPLHLLHSPLPTSLLSSSPSSLIRAPSNSGELPASYHSVTQGPHLLALPHFVLQYLDPFFPSIQSMNRTAWHCIKSQKNESRICGL